MSLPKSQYAAIRAEKIIIVDLAGVTKVNQLAKKIFSNLKSNVMAWMFTDNNCKAAINIAISYEPVKDLSSIKHLDDDASRAVNTMASTLLGLNRDDVVIIDGQTLDFIKEQSLANLFFAQALKTKSVICRSTSSTQKVALLEYLQKITTVTLYLEENDPWRLDEVTRRTVGKTDQQETDRLALMQEQLEKMMEQLQELKDMQS